jgi:hypothetical protein
MAAWPKGTARGRLAGRSGPLKRVHVNKHVIAANVKHGRNDPAITVQTSAGSFTAYRVVIHGPSIMRSDKPLPCGARVYVETHAQLIWDEDAAPYCGRSTQ